MTLESINWSTSSLILFRSSCWTITRFTRSKDNSDPYTQHPSHLSPNMFISSSKRHLLLGNYSTIEQYFSAESWHWISTFNLQPKSFWYFASILTLILPKYCILYCLDTNMKLRDMNVMTQTHRIMCRLNTCMTARRVSKSKQRQSKCKDLQFKWEGK